MKKLKQVLYENTVVGSKGDKYVVSLRLGFVDDAHAEYSWTCTCPHHTYRNVRCKHIEQVTTNILGLPKLDSEPFIYDEIADGMEITFKCGHVMKVVLEDSHITPFFEATTWANMIALLETYPEHKNIYKQIPQMKRIVTYGLYDDNPHPQYTMYAQGTCFDCGKNLCGFPTMNFFAQFSGEEVPLQIIFCKNPECKSSLYNIKTIKERMNE